MKISVEFLGKSFKNPIVAASGTFGFGREYGEFYDLGKLGAIATKGLTLHPKEGNSGTRIYETPSGLMNSIGLQNPGVKAFISDEYEHMKGYNTEIFVNLGGGSEEEYIRGLELLNETDCEWIELNISCPNVKHGGMQFGRNRKTVGDIVGKARRATSKKLIVKLTPNAEDVAETAAASEENGADAVSLVNTFKAMAIDVKKRKPVFDNIIAGLSGPAIFPIALRMVYETAKIVKIPVVGMGGVMKGEDAIAFMMAGATLVEVGTANFRDPLILMNIIREMEEFCEREGVSDISELIGVF